MDLDQDHEPEDSVCDRFQSREAEVPGHCQERRAGWATRGLNLNELPELERVHRSTLDFSESSGLDKLIINSGTDLEVRENRNIDLSIANGTIIISLWRKPV